MRALLVPIQLAQLGLPESTRPLLVTRPQACQGFGAQGTAFLRQCFGGLRVWDLLANLTQIRGGGNFEAVPLSNPGL